MNWPLTQDKRTGMSLWEPSQQQGLWHSECVKITPYWFFNLYVHEVNIYTRSCIQIHIDMYINRYIDI